MYHRMLMMGSLLSLSILLCLSCKHAPLARVFCFSLYSNEIIGSCDKFTHLKVKDTLVKPHRLKIENTRWETVNTHRIS